MTMNGPGQAQEHGSLDRDEHESRWQRTEYTPIRQNTRAICRTKLNSARPDISLVPLAAWSVFDFSCENKSARLGSS